MESVWAALGKLTSADWIVRKVLELLNRAIGIKDKPPANFHDVPLFFFLQIPIHSSCIFQHHIG